MQLDALLINIIDRNVSTHSYKMEKLNECVQIS